MEQYMATYERNCKCLLEYPWWRYGKLPIYEELSNTARQINMEDYTPTYINTRTFFRDLSKPLLVKNERNSYHFGYLVDNVRASEDYGGDNHIYMYYDSKEEFYRLLQAVDITPYLAGKKIVFLLGKEELTRNYPLDFKKEYSIDYEAMGEKPLRVEEIQRLVIHWHNWGYSGNVFWRGIIDWHKNFLTIKDMGLSGIHYIYEKILKGHTIKEVYGLLMNNESDFIKAEFDALFLAKHILQIPGKSKVPSLVEFFDKLENLFPENYRPEEHEWLKGMFLAYNAVLRRELNCRIAPSIVFMAHGIKLSIAMNDNLKWIMKFKYFRCVSMLRRSTIAAASYMESYLKKGIVAKNLVAIANIISPQSLKKSMGDCYEMPLYAEAKSVYLPYTKIIRFEDLKLEPRATLEAMLDFLDAEWDDSLLHTTSNGQREVWNGSMKPVKDFDTAPVLKKREKMIAPFDYYRMELLMGDFLAPWGYKPQYYTDGKTYTNDEIVEMFKKPFRCEEFLFTSEQRKVNKEYRKYLIEAVRDRLAMNSCAGKEMRKLLPIPWLKPKAEFMQGKLYE